jgi:hypothetical protein
MALMVLVCLVEVVSQGFDAGRKGKKCGRMYGKKKNENLGERRKT